MATIYKLHPKTPQVRLIETIQESLKNGAVMLYPTDTVYAIGCDLNVKSAVERVRQIKRLSNNKPLTFLCSSLSNVAEYAQVSDTAYRLIKRLIPGPYTFLLPATKHVPRLVMDPKRKTTGIRVPDHVICQSLLTALGNPIISTSATTMIEPENGFVSPVELFDRLDKLVDIIIDDDSPVTDQVSTILDLTEAEPVVIRKGLGWDAAVDWVGEVEVR